MATSAISLSGSLVVSLCSENLVASARQPDDLIGNTRDHRYQCNSQYYTESRILYPDKKEQDDTYKNYKKHKARPTAFVDPGASHYIVDSQGSSILHTVDALMLCPMILVQSVNILHQTDCDNIDHKDQYPDDSFYDRKQGIISDILYKQR